MADDESKSKEPKSKEPLWSINPKWRVWFYVALLFCVFVVFILTLVGEWSKVVSILTLADEWSKWSKNCLEIFDVLWSRILGSVIVVWLVFQVMELAMGAYQAYLDWREARLREAQDQARRELEEQARKEAEAFQKRYNEGLMKAGVTEEQIQQAQQLSGSIPPSPPPPSPR